MRLLAVEDEPKADDQLQPGLMESGYVVDVARNGADGLHLARLRTLPGDRAALLMLRFPAGQLLASAVHYAQAPSTIVQTIMALRAISSAMGTVPTDHTQEINLISNEPYIVYVVNPINQINRNNKINNIFRLAIILPD